MAKNNKNIPILCDRLLKRTRYELGGGGGHSLRKRKYTADKTPEEALALENSRGANNVITHLYRRSCHHFKNRVMDQQSSSATLKRLNFPLPSLASADGFPPSFHIFSLHAIDELAPSLTQCVIAPLGF